MKISKILLPVLALSLTLSACHKPDELIRENNENVMHLTVKATLVQNGVEYDATIDDENHTVLLNIPYFISDTEEIMSDLSAIKLRATMPLGAKFEPGISGIRDFSDGQEFVTDLVYEDGTRNTYVFTAARKKSDNSSLAKAILTDEDVRAVFSITEPSKDNPKGKLTVLKTSGAVEAALGSVKITPAPWATIVAEGYDASTGIINLNVAKEIKVISQDGASNTIYEVVIDTPSTVPAGNIGYISNLFGLQCTAVNSLGFEQDANCSMAAIDNYLIISNKHDLTKSAVFNRFSGRVVTDVKINTSGIDAGRELRAISTDDEGHLVAATYTCTKEPTDVTVNAGWDYLVTPTAIKVYLWENGITAAPKLIMDLDIKSAEMLALPSKAAELFNMMAVKGSLTSGDAVITSTEAGVGRIIAFYFSNGEFKKVEQYCPYDVNGKLFWLSTKNASKAIPLNTSSPLSYCVIGDFRPQIGWSTGVAAGSFIFEAPKSHWWVSNGNYDYAKNMRGGDVVEFNGTQLLAVSNGNLSSGVWGHRLYVANIGMTPTPTSLQTGFLFDSREGDATHGAGTPEGTGYGPSGMTSTYPYVGADGVFGGTNLTKRGDVIFVPSADGNSVQVYMFTANAGLLGYEITRYDM